MKKATKDNVKLIDRRNMALTPIYDYSISNGGHVFNSKNLTKKELGNDLASNLYTDSKGRAFNDKIRRKSIRILTKKGYTWNEYSQYMDDIEQEYTLLVFEFIADYEKHPFYMGYEADKPRIISLGNVPLGYVYIEFLGLFWKAFRRVMMNKTTCTHINRLNDGSLHISIDADLATIDDTDITPNEALIGVTYDRYNLNDYNDISKALTDRLTKGQAHALMMVIRERGNIKALSDADQRAQRRAKEALHNDAWFTSLSYEDKLDMIHVLIQHDDQVAL